MKATAQMGGLTLLPCPFCGSLSGLHEDRNIFPEGPGWRVECEGACHAMTCYWHIATDAVAHWNLRQSLSLESVRSEALEEALLAILHTYDEGGVPLGRAFEMANAALKRDPNIALSPARVAEEKAVDENELRK